MNTFGIRRFLTNKLYFGLSTLILSFACFSAYAGFEVQEGDPHIEYGNAQNETFRRAVEYEESLDANDRSFLASVEQQAVTNRWYWKALLARPKAQIEDVRVEFTGSPTVTLPGDEDEVFQFIIGFGHKWNRWAAEMELLISESLTYRLQQIYNIQAKANIKNWVLFLNTEYEIPTFFDFIPNRFHPYINAGVGVSVKTVDTQAFNAVGQATNLYSERSNTFAWHAGLGSKFQVTSNILVDIAYRWMQFGEADFANINGVSIKATDLVSRGFYLGITYQL